MRDVSAPEVGRLKTGIAELDRVLGGGLVPGSIVLLGGAPGIGKSTLTGMGLGNLSAAGHRVLYVSGEESTAQVRLRAERLGAGALAVPALAETSLEAVTATLEAERPAACVIDSVQTLHAEGISGAPGSVGQVRKAASGIMDVAKRIDCAVILVGHVTKDGAVARATGAGAPRRLRALLRGRARAQLPHAAGAQEPLRRDQRGRRVRDALRWARGGRGSARRASSPRRARRPGSAVLCSMEGTRPLLVEVQALVAPTEIVPPRRVATGIDRNRLAMVLAVLGATTAARRWRPPTSSSTSPAAIRIDEPGADLAVALALRLGASRGGAEPTRRAGRSRVLGEIGLTGELRSVRPRPSARRRGARVRPRPGRSHRPRPSRSTGLAPESSVRGAIGAALRASAHAARAA